VDFDPTLKKKKKKKVVLEGDDDEAVEAVTGEMDDLEGAIPPVRPSIARWRSARKRPVGSRRDPRAARPETP
jgi:hypothetical protein